MFINQLTQKLPFHTKKIHIAYVLMPLMAVAAIIALYTIVAQEPVYLTVRVKGSPGNWWWVTPSPPEWLSTSIQKGDVELNTLGKEIARVEDIEILEAEEDAARDLFLTVRLKVNYNKTMDRYRFKGEAVDVGAPISLAFGNTLFPGIVTEIIPMDETGKRSYIDKLVTVKVYDKWPWEYEAIVVGETVNDHAGATVIEIIDKRRAPSEKEAYTDDGRIVKAFSQVKEDFFVTFKLKLEPREQGLVFSEDELVKVGRKIWLTTPSYEYDDVYIMEIQDME